MYPLQDLVDNLKLEVVSNDMGLENISIKGVYIGDLLSWVMANIKEGDAWITIQTHLNIVAVAALGEASCIIIPEGAKIDNDTINKAVEQKIPILKSNLTAYDLAVRINKLVDKK